MLVDWLLALTPILLVLFLMLGLRWKGTRAGPTGWLAAVLIAALRFGAGWQVLAWAQLKGLLLALWVLYIIWAALLFYRVTDEAGVITTVGADLPRLTADRALQVLLLGWAFGSFLQGVSGFGVPVAVLGPLLVGLGFPPVAAVVIPSIGHSWAVTFGSLGSSFYALMAATGRPGEELAAPAAAMLGLTCLLCGAGVLWAAGGPRTLRQGAAPLLVVGLAMAGAQYLVVTHGLWSIGGMSGGLAGLGVGVLWARWRNGRSLQETAPAPEERAGRVAPTARMRLGWALFPYALLVTIMNAIWVRRGEADREALRKALEVLHSGGVLGIAPEGTRSRETQALQQGKVGTAYLATRADVPIVPVGISGTEQIRHRVRQLRRTDVRLAVGEPFRLPASGRVRGRQLEEYTDLIMRRIAELLPEEYRGVYA